MLGCKSLSSFNPIILLIFVIYDFKLQEMINEKYSFKLQERKYKGNEEIFILSKCTADTPVKTVG